ncbi:MAG: FAD-binding oxidoreductase [Anaerolineae bacterium]|nr:FAD-binding oxidoreductase [Anaerolineae bacterium]
MHVMTSSLQKQMILTQIADIIGAENILTSETDRLAYGVDVFWVPTMLVDRGEVPPLPDVVVQPETVEQISELVKLANVYRIPVIPWGGGSGSQGGIIPVYGGLTIDLKKLNRILDINETNLTVTAQAGINGHALEQALNARGLTFPHYPASVHSATLGGYIAPRGSGVLSTKYGKIESLVLNVQVVLPNGDVIRTLPVPAHASGPGILDLFMGAEGSYGIITEATVMIAHEPAERRFRAWLFPDVTTGLEAGRRIMTDRLEPSVIRVYDEASTATRIKSILGLEAQGSYAVFGFDGWHEVVEAQEQRALAICRELGGEDLGREPGEHWWNHRYDFYFPPKMLMLPWMFGTMDTVCPFDKMESLYRAKQRLFLEDYARYNVKYIAHFSHWYKWGVMVYDRFIIEEPPRDPDEALRLHNELWNAAVRTSIKHGGVMNEHHGVGLKLARLVREQYGSAFQILEGLKRSLDPQNILNPGKMGFGPPSA